MRQKHARGCGLCWRHPAGRCQEAKVSALSRGSRRAHPGPAMYTEKMQKSKVLLSLLACLVAIFLAVPTGAQTKSTDKKAAKSAQQRIGRPAGSQQRDRRPAERVARHRGCVFEKDRSGPAVSVARTIGFQRRRSPSYLRQDQGPGDRQAGQEKVAAPRRRSCGQSVLRTTGAECARILLPSS